MSAVRRRRGAGDRGYVVKSGHALLPITVGRQKLRGREALAVLYTFVRIVLALSSRREKKKIRETTETGT